MIHIFKHWRALEGIIPLDLPLSQPFIVVTSHFNPTLQRNIYTLRTVNYELCFLVDGAVDRKAKKTSIYV